MSRSLSRQIHTILTVLAVLVLFCGSTCASFGADRETKAFNVHVKVNVDNSYEFTETLDTVFNSSGHGIYRYIPEYFNGTHEKVGAGWCDGRELETFHENNNYVLQIGSADVYLYGDEQFKYGYKIQFLDDRDTTRDLLYMNVLPTNWQTPIEKSTITMELPKSIKGYAMKVYYGSHYSEETVPAEGKDGISWKLSDSGKELTIKGSDLDQGVGITVMVDLPEGYWEGQANTDWMKYTLIGLLVTLAALFLVLWSLFGRTRKPVETVEFYPPEDMTPAEVGYLADGCLDKKDMISMFMYYAEKGYLEIIPDGKKEFTFKKLRDIDASEKKFSQILYQGIFSGKTQEKKLSKMGVGFARKYQSAKAALDDQMSPVPISCKVLHWLLRFSLFPLAIVLGVLSELYVVSGASDSGTVLGSCFFMALLTQLLCRSMRKRRSHEGIVGKLPFLIVFIGLELILLGMGASGIWTDFQSILVTVLFVVCTGLLHFITIIFYKIDDDLVQTFGKLLGLRRFIQTAEEPRINALVEENPNYFYDILPYAYVMGVTKKWAKNFEHVNVDPPEWYHGTYDTPYFNTIYFANSMGDFGHAVSHGADFSIPDTSHSSGFSGGSSGGFSGGFGGGSFGGGFSGGGGGGGGGGFW